MYFKQYTLAILLMTTICLLFARVKVEEKGNSPLYQSAQKLKLIFSDDFSKDKITDNWQIEKAATEDGVCSVVSGQMQLNSEGGVTVWYKNELKGNLLIEYDRTVVMDSGKYDRLSDLNQFWMATDPQHKMFTRQGGFREYDTLQMYYVGMGGNYNTTTRMRRYDGKGTLQIVKEYTDSAHLLKPNKKYHIQIKVENGTSTFSVDDVLFFSFKDANPLNSGWFAIRSTKSRQLIDNVKIWQLD
jgi:rhamnogalacturonan endolyase